MRLGILIVINVCISHGQIRESEYECGVHGRFEYCIDGIPGCVIGCHCHPGFYFDTDTKICEPNIKLTQNFRRQYNYVEPTRAHYAPVTPSEYDEPTTIKKNAIDEKIDEMTKDVDDLGDWLYNQFFKTIENQVINETKDESIVVTDRGVMTRRSGDNPSFIGKPSRRSHKYWRARKKKKRKNKRKGLKSKLLRITEDDSLFDSSSSSTSDESSDNSDSSSEPESEDSSGGRRKKKKNNSNHGHKKIIMMNKRPRPPLPSFIFLPNMDTPFFPPIGLPPPAMPMYPMVPVPPMMPPFYPFPGVTPHSNVDETETTTSTSPAAEITNGHTTTGIATISQTTEVHSLTISPDIGIPEERIEKLRDEIQEYSSASLEETVSLFRNHTIPRSGPRYKLMQKLRNKLKRKNKLQNHFANEYLGQKSPITDVDASPDYLPDLVASRHKPMSPQINLAEGMQVPPSGLQDVDFKYLSQLIHKADLNKTNHGLQKDQMEIGITQSQPYRRNYYENYHPNDITQVLDNLANSPSHHIPNQPFYTGPNEQYPNIPYRKKIENTNDTYYANLGRQIASMIRNIDANKEVDIEIEKTNIKPLNNGVFNGNSYGSRSYWERSIRSPFKYLMNSLKNEMNYLKKSNENLFSLENQVEIAASTEPILGLRELENIISQIDKAKSNLIKKNGSYNSAETSSTSFNVNLLPGNGRSFYYEEEVNHEPHNIGHKLNVHSYNANGRKQSLNPLQPQLENINSRHQNWRGSKQPEYKDMITQSQNGQRVLGPVFHNINTRRQQFHLESLQPYSKDILESSFQPEIKKSLQSPLQPELKNSLTNDYDFLLQDTYSKGNNTENSIAQMLPTRKPNTNVAPHYKIPNNMYNSYAYTVLPLPQKLELAQKPPIITSLNVPLMSVTTSRTYYQQLNPMVVNQNNNNWNYYSGNNNPYTFEKGSIPLKLRSYTNRLGPSGGRVEPSYFHQVIHHFDYFDI